MANKPLKSVKFPGLGDTYTIPQVDTTLAVTGAAADSKKVGDELTELKADLAQVETGVKSAYIYDTASGAIASFDDGADGVPVKDLVVDIEPLQDLHGQANPYPAGGGKNIFDPNVKFTAGTYYGLTFSTTDGYRYTLNGTATDSGNIVTSSVASQDAVILPAGTYYSKVGMLSLYKADGTWLRNQYSGVAFTVDESFFVKNVYIEIVSGRTYNYNEFLAIEKGSTAPTEWTPYANICPISGWTGANVSRTGKNLVNISAANEVRKNGGSLFTLTYSDNNTVEMSTSSTGALSVIWEILKVTPNLVGTYLTRSNSGSQGCYFYKTRDADGSWTPAPTSYQSNATTIQLTENDVGHAIGIGFYNSSGTTKTISNVQVEFGQTATAFEPFTGTTYSITFPTEAGTVYGGTLDVTTGVLTVDKGYMKVGNNFSYAGGNIFAYSTSLPKQPTSNSNKADIISSEFPSVSQVNLANGYGIAVPATTDYIRINAPGYTTDQAFAEAFSDVDIVFALKTPVTYQLDPVTIATLLGQNNIWADCGGTTVDYRADTKLYIEQLTAPTEDDMVANTNIPDATYFMVGNTLYLSTTTIPAGDTINPGTNCTKMDLAAALNAINA